MKPSPRPTLLLAALAAMLIAAPVAADRRDQDAAYLELRAGGIRPLREIEARYAGRVPGAAYLGPEYDAGSATYRLKFMRGGHVIWIDVDARTGRELGRSGE